MAIKKAEAVIQDATDFYHWGVEVNESTTVTYIYLSQEDMTELICTYRRKHEASNQYQIP